MNILRVLLFVIFASATYHQTYALYNSTDENLIQATCRNCKNCYVPKNQDDGENLCHHELCVGCFKIALINNFFYNSDEMFAQYQVVKNFHCSLCHAWITVGFESRYQSDD
jgi:hypothetical protein